MRTADRRSCAPRRGLPWRTVALGILVVLHAAAPAPAAGLDEFVGKPVLGVDLVSDGRPLRDAAVLALVETRVGVPLSMRQVRESVTHLFSLGRFENIEVGGSVRDGGVVLQYVLAPLQLVERIEVDGRPGVSVAELRRAVTDAHGPAFGAEQAPAVAATLRRYYRERGFLAAAVETRVERRGARQVLRVAPRPGSRVRIDRFTVRGVSATMYPLILNRLGLERGMPYDGRDIERRLRDYEAELHRRRFYEASLDHEIEVLDGGGLADLVLDVRQGPRITVELAGDPLPDADLDALVPIERERSVEEDLLEDADRRIATLLRDRGYRDAVVEHAREADGEGLSLVFTAERGRLYRIDRVAFEGNAAVPESELAPLLTVEPDSPLVMRELEVSADLVAEHYRRLGYPTVRVEPRIAELAAAGAPAEPAVRVLCTIAIVEGPRATVRSVTVEGSAFRGSAELVATMESRVGSAYFAREVAADRDRIHALYLDAGYDRAVVAVEPRFDDSLTAVDLLYRIAEGPQTLIEHILITGNETIGSDSIRQEITLEEGQPLGLAAVAETRRRLNALGLFRRIDIREFSHGRRDRRDVVIVVEEAAATRLAYGGGFEVSQRLRRETDAGRGVSQAVEQLEFAPRGFVQIGRRNLWGKNRSIDLFTRVSVRRQNDPVLFAPAERDSGFGFNEYRVLGTYTEPRAFGLAWDLYVTGFVEEAIRPGFDLFSRGFNAETRGQMTPSLSTSVAYSWGKNDTSNVQLNPQDVPLVDRLFEKVRLSSFSGSLVRDTRDDLVDPTDGEVLSVDARVAGRAIGSEVGFAKAFTQAFIYRRMPGARRIVLAAGVRVGLAVGFPRGGVGSHPLLPISERFFAGGDTTVRGYAFDRLGIPAEQPGATIDHDGFPQGGNAVVILNSEVRVPVTRDLGVVGFLDGGNVYDHVSNIRLGQIRGGVGFGVRYASPVGPIRVDLGFKLDRQELGSGPNRERERLTALHISIGQAF